MQLNKLPQNLSSSASIPNVSAVSRIIIPVIPVKDATLHWATARNRERG